MVELRARRFSAPDFHAFDLLIGMDSGHIDLIEAARPPQAKVTAARFLDFTPALVRRAGHDVPDPYSGDEADFEHALDLIEQGTPGLLAAVRSTYL